VNGLKVETLFDLREGSDDDVKDGDESQDHFGLPLSFLVFPSNFLRFLHFRCVRLKL
jgi:hypothetical protein